MRELIKTLGGVAERLIATVLKTVVPKGTGGSNPLPSANQEKHSSALAGEFFIDRLHVGFERERETNDFVLSEARFAATWWCKKNPLPSAI